MAVDPRSERLPEYEGPAFRTWQLIMQTTMGSVVQQSSVVGPAVLNNQIKLNKSKFAAAEEFISLNSESPKTEDSVLDSSKKLKESKKEDSGPYIPWIKKGTHYPENPIG